MSKKVTKTTSDRYASRRFRKDRIRNKLSGTAECPRMNVFKSDIHFVVQLIDDETGSTLLQCSTMDKELRGLVKANVTGAKKMGKLVAEKAIEKNIKKVVFDRNGYRYHGAVKALADAAREAGLTI
ncbi:MAG TPA: 50S ribosomal protein L18 [bacterium]|nr:50S ribosomal protein L18 [bacterium]